MRHLDEGTIHAWLDGALSEEKARQAEEHAARCTQCAIAVADARGFIAGASRILLALDDVPRGVVPVERPALGARRSALGTTTAPRYKPWMLKVAASVVVVAGTTLLLTRTGTRVPQMARIAESKTDSFSPANGAASAPAALGGAASDVADARAAQGAVPVNAPAPAVDQKADALLKAKSATEMSAERRAPSAEPESLPAPRQLATATATAAGARVDSTAASPVTNQVASVAPKIEVYQSSGAPGAAGAAKRSIGGQDAAMPPGMRMVSEQTITAQARVVQKRVYEVSPGVQVIYSIFESLPARSTAAESDSGAAPKDESADSEPGVNTIKWSDSTGTDFMLSGRLPLDSLRVIRAKLPVPRKE